MMCPPKFVVETILTEKEASV